MSIETHKHQNLIKDNWKKVKRERGLKSHISILKSKKMLHSFHLLTLSK